MSSIVNFIRGKADSFPLNFQYIRVGRAEAFLERANALGHGVIWNVEEVDSLDELKLMAVNGEEIDAYVLNLDVTEDNLEDLRRAFWNKLIWGGINHLPLAIVIPAKRRAHSLDERTILAGLSLIRLTDRPWKVFVNGEGFEAELMEWLVSIASSYVRGFEKKELVRQEEAQRREEEKGKKKA